jgi:hypothetical protein
MEQIDARIAGFFLPLIYRNITVLAAANWSRLSTKTKWALPLQLKVFLHTQHHCSISFCFTNPSFEYITPGSFNILLGHMMSRSGSFSS